MTHRIRLPEAYILASSDVPDSEWLGDLLRACISTVKDIGSIEIVDEFYASANADVISAAVKLTAPMSDEKFQMLSQDLRSPMLHKLNVRIVKVQPQDTEFLDQTELRIEYFRHEFAKDSQMVRHTESPRFSWRPVGLSQTATTA